MSEPRNVGDTEYSTLDGMRPMREVLRERHGFHHRQNKALRERSFRIRAGMQAELASCLCCFPLEKAETSSEHQEWCPSHAMRLSSLEADRIAGERAAGRMPP